MIIKPIDIQYMHSRCQEFGTLSPRELEIYLAGQADGKSIKADEVQPTISRLELMFAGGAEITGPLEVTFR